jgi:hypothetical protein
MLDFFIAEPHAQQFVLVHLGDEAIDGDAAFSQMH